MKAARIHRHGGVNEFVIEEVASPVIGADDVLVKVIAAGVNPADWQFRRGDFAAFVPLRFPAILGWDVAGTVAAVGANVAEFAIGDPVFAMCDMSRPGAYAERIAVDHRHLAPVPTSLPLNHAAAVPLAALTAWHALHDLGVLHAGRTVMVHAAAGGVGQFAVQLANAAGATVIASASTRNHGLLRSLGATECFDYRDADWPSHFARRCDLVIDGAGGETRRRSWDLLKAGGMMVAVAMPPIDPTEAASRGSRTAFAQVIPNGTRLGEIAAMIDTGKLAVTIDSQFSLADVAAAHARSESRQACGKIILNVSKTSSSTHSQESSR